MNEKYLKEQSILKCKNILEAILLEEKGIGNIYKLYQHNGEDYQEILLEDKTISSWDMFDWSVFAEGLKDDYLQTQLKETHNQYVALLSELRSRTQKDLSELLKQ